MGFLLVVALLAPASVQAAPTVGEVVHAAVLVAEGQQAFTQGMTSAAISCLSEAEGLRPDWLAPVQWLALAQQVGGNRDASLAAYASVQRESLATGSFRRNNPPDQLAVVIECEALTAWLVNQTRYETQLNLLLPDPKLGQVARQHSLEMRDLGYFDHESPVEGRKTSLDRFQQLFGFRAQLIAENVARRWGSEYLLTAERITDTHQRFLKSPEHRRSLILPGVERMGVGIAVDATGNYWVTEVLAKYQGGS